MRRHTVYQATGCQTSREERGPRQPSRPEESRVCGAWLKRNGQFSRCGRRVYPHDPGWNDGQCTRCLGIHRNHRQATPPGPEESIVCMGTLKRNGRTDYCGRRVYPHDPGYNEQQCPRCLGIHRNHRQATPPMDFPEMWPAQSAYSEHSAHPDQVSRISSVISL